MLHSASDNLIAANRILGGTIVLSAAFRAVYGQDAAVARGMAAAAGWRQLR